MLTKDLIRYRTAGAAVRPRFVDTEDPEALGLAAELLALYNPEARLSRGAIEEMAGPVIKARRDWQFPAGLDKLIQDKCEFASAHGEDWRGARAKIFAAAAPLFKAGGLSVEEYRERVAAASGVPASLLDSGIYSDLPENEALVSAPKISPRELLQRYNCSLVQSLLFYSGKLVLTVSDPDPANMRRLVKYLKFFRLLALVSASKGTPERPSEIRMEIDGPASLFENTRKYGLQLAAFFPAVCLLPKWAVEAEIKIDDRTLSLKLDENSGLVSHYRHFGAYVPEEVRLFHSHFKEKAVGWKISASSDFIHAGGGSLVFPDLSFERESDGKTVHLELFHRWHASQLPARLKFCESQKDVPLILGVDRHLAESPEARAMLDASAFFQSRGFLFRDFPGVDNVLKALAASDSPGSPKGAAKKKGRRK